MPKTKHRYTPYRYADPAEQFGIADTDTARIRWKTRTAPFGRRTVEEELLGAVYQHLVMISVRAGLRATGRSQRGFCRVTGFSETRLSNLLHGNQPAHQEDYGFLTADLSLSLPIEATGYLAAVQQAHFVRRQATVAPAVPSVTRLLEAHEMLVALGGPDVRIYDPSPDELATAEALEAAATGPAQAAASALIRAVAKDRPSDVSVTITADQVPGATGDATGEGGLLWLTLPEDWTETVASPGWTVIDNHFVITVRCDTQGRPATASVLTLRNTTPEQPDAENDADYTFAATPMSIRWEPSGPRLVPLGGD